MALWTWWRGDARPELTPLPGMTVERSDDVKSIQGLTALGAGEVLERLAARHRFYFASIDRTPVAYGWVATLSAEIGELCLQFDIPAGDRYLWDFVTLPDWRGRGIYPRLLQAILAGEGPDARRFWIIHAPENGASSSGIGKAGFQEVSELAFLRDQGVGSHARTGSDRARIGAQLLRVPLVDLERAGTSFIPCWRCVTGVQSEAERASCGCLARDEDGCTCLEPVWIPIPVKGAESS